MFRADETNFREGKRQPATPRRRRFGGRFSLFARRRSPLFAGGTRYAPRHARRGGSSSSQKVLRYFLGTLCSGHAFENARRLHPFRKPKYRQIGVRCAKAWFCLRESFYKSIHEICFVLTKQISVSGRGNPNGFPLAAAYFRAHRKGMPRLHPFRKPRYRQIGVRGAKAWFWHAQEIIHEICFELTKQISVSGRALPSAARALSGHAFFICRKAARRGARAPRGCAAQGRGLAFASGPAFAKGCVHI